MWNLLAQSCSYSKRGLLIIWSFVMRRYIVSDLSVTHSKVALSPQFQLLCPQLSLLYYLPIKDARLFGPDKCAHVAPTYYSFLSANKLFVIFFKSLMQTILKTGWYKIGLFFGVLTDGSDCIDRLCERAFCSGVYRNIMELCG